MACKEGIVYTPEMYEYFFLEDEGEKSAQSKDGNTSQSSSTDLALPSTSSAVATWPEAYEFFFADGPQDQDKEGILFGIPSSQVQNAADIIQSFVPERLKGFSMRRSHHRRGPDGRLIPQERHETSTDSDASTSALLANIGAVSAIQYLRRRSRRTWQESPPRTGDET